MESFFSLLDGSLIILALVLFFATLVVIYFLLSRTSNQRRVAFLDRRRSREKLIFPFYDSEHMLVNEERRFKNDRRKARSIYVGDGNAAI